MQSEATNSAIEGVEKIVLGDASIDSKYLEDAHWKRTLKSKENNKNLKLDIPVTLFPRCVSA